MDTNRKSLLRQTALKDQRGFALVSVYLASVVILIISTAAFASVFSESRHISREIMRTQAYAAAEAGLQSALAQIGQNAYTGFISTNAIGSTSLQSVTGTTVGNFSVAFSYPNQADWVICTATATADNETRLLEGRIFLQSNLSKYLMYANTTTVGLGTNLVMGVHDGINPQGVSANETDRAALYYTNNLDFSGSNIHIYGDTHAENFISGSSSNTVHGDTYVGGFQTDAQGRVTNDGINGTLTITDGFSDDIDRDGDGTINANDYPDRHDLTADGRDDSHAEEVLDSININFYRDNNSEIVKQKGYGDATAQTRYLVLEPTADGTQTKVIVYNNQTRYNNDERQYKVDEYTLPASAILYNNADLHVKGTVAGRISFVSSDDVFFDGNVKYSGNNSYASAQHSAAFLAKDVVYFTPVSLEVSGIVYADKSSSSSVAIDSDYNQNGLYRPQDKYNGHFRLFGNLIVDGTGNTSNYALDRAYIYDPKLKYYRPPGLPVRPELRMVRET